MCAFGNFSKLRKRTPSFFRSSASCSTAIAATEGKAATLTIFRGRRPTAKGSLFCFSGNYFQNDNTILMWFYNSKLTLNDGFTFIFFSFAFILLVLLTGVDAFDPLRRSGVPVALPGADLVWPVKFYCLAMTIF